MSEKTLADSHLRLAGWLSIVSAIITVPLFLLAIFASSEESTTRELVLFSTLLFIFHTGIYCYVYLTFRDYLHRHFSFHTVDKQISVIVGVSIIAALLQVIAYMFAEGKDIASFVTVLLIIPLGIVSIQMVLYLLNLRDSLFGLKSAYAYSLIFSGIFLTSIVLLLPGLFLGIVLDSLLGIILIRAGTERIK